MRQQIKMAGVAALAALMMAMTACGGGGGSSSSSSGTGSASIKGVATPSSVSVVTAQNASAGG